MKKIYTSAEVAEMFGISDRTVRRHLQAIADSITAKDKGYSIRLDVVRLMAGRYNYNLPADINGHYDHVEYFTDEEYQEFHKRLVEYPLLLDKIKMLLDELNFHKKQILIHQSQQTKLIESIKERNFIEAKEKHLDK